MDVFRKSDRDGEVIIDHSESPGFTEQAARALGRTILLDFGLPKVLKVRAYSCSHCDKVVMRNPFRTRNRFECPQCDRPICDDPCAVNFKLDGICRCRSKRIEEHMKQVARSSPTLLTP